MLLWLWLWCRVAAVALIPPLAWGFPYATGMALKSKKIKIKKKKLRVPIMTQRRQILLGTMRLRVRFLAYSMG